MKNEQRLWVFVTSIIFLCFYSNLSADEFAVNSINNNQEINSQLDLNAVASIFGESKDLGDFEKRLNDPLAQISNLDLNNDGEVDYLRVVEIKNDTVHMVVIQAVLENDYYQDIATIEVKKDNYEKHYVHIVGDQYLYGNNYVIETTYDYIPSIYTIFGIGGLNNALSYPVYRSPYRWRYYPSYYRPWGSRPISYYRQYIYRYINPRNYYKRSYARPFSPTRIYYSRNYRRNDFGRLYPRGSFSNRQINNRSTNRWNVYNPRVNFNPKSNFSNRGNYSSQRNISNRGNYSNQRNTSSSRGNYSSQRNISNSRSIINRGNVNNQRSNVNSRRNTYTPRSSANTRNNLSRHTATTSRSASNYSHRTTRQGNTMGARNTRTSRESSSVRTPRDTRSTRNTRGNQQTNRNSSSDRRKVY